MNLFRNYDFESNEILKKWREDVFRFIRISLLIGGTLSIALAVSVSLRENLFSGIIVVNGIALFNIFFINAFKNTNFNVRLYLMVATFYLIAGMSFYSIGFRGNFWIWLFITTISLAVFKNAALVFKFLVFNALLIIAVGLMLHFEILHFKSLTEFSIILWLVNSVIFTWINGTFLLIILIARNIILNNFLKEKEIRLIRENEAITLLKIKEKLEESEAMYKEAEHIAHLGSWKFNVISEEGYWSEEIYKIFLRDPALGAPTLTEYLEYIHPEDREVYYKGYKEIIKNTDASKFEYRILLNGHVIKYIEGIARKKVDEQNHIIGMYGTFMDITERKLKEIILEESEAVYKEAEKLANLGSWKLDLINNRVHWSKEMYKIFMRNPALGAPFLSEYLEYIHPDERKNYYESHIETLKSIEPITFQFRILLKGNIIKYIEGTARKKIDENNNVLEMHGILMDSTDRRLKEIKLKEREESYKEAQELAHLGHWEYDAATDKTYWSEELYRILNWDNTKPAPKVRDYIEHIHPEDLDRYKDRVKMWMSSPEKDFFEFRYYTPDGGIRYLEAITRKRINSHGKVVYLYGTMLDITERVHVRNQLRENLEKLKKKNQELDKFSYSTSHELRAPITSALGLTNLMKLEFDSNKAVLKYVGMLEKSLKGLGEFITEIADFSRNEKHDVEVSEIDIVNMIDQIISELSFMEGAKNIKFSVQAANNVKLYSDKLRVQTILSNLISNAIKYHDFVKDNQYIKITLSETDSQLRIICEDNGLGIDKEYQKKVFDMFFTTGSKSYGTGLGLYILKESVGKLGGKVSFESEKRVGTTFKIEIPNHVTVTSDASN